MTHGNYNIMFRFMMSMSMFMRHEIHVIGEEEEGSYSSEPGRMSFIGYYRYHISSTHQFLKYFLLHIK